MKVTPIAAVLLALVFLSLPACSTHKEEHHQEAHTIVATYPRAQSVTLTQQYVCQIHSQRHVQIRALERGYLEAIEVKEGQPVKAEDVLFKVIPILYQKKADAEIAEARRAQLEFDYTKKLFQNKVVSENELSLLEAKLARAKAQAELASAELGFATVKAPFDGIIDRLYQQQGSLIEEGEVLTTMSDNSVMWVYFNVPEKRYLEYMADLKQHQDLKIELVLANGNKFDQPGEMTWDGTSWKAGAIEADFNNETGNIPFRADFPNPKRLLRHGQTGTVLISRVEDGAIVIPQRATFEVLAKRFVYVIDGDNVAHQREITIENELEDIFVIKSGLDVTDRIVLEGIRQIRDGDKVEYQELAADKVGEKLKFHAE
ncbi:MAG TPA: efflux RND transporter periplasmic adaptor subunit [Pirellulales bacterium]|nr:efflux RND transporter periplasmic adaptor subunit [Pirellulales bacterium]